MKRIFICCAVVFVLMVWSVQVVGLIMDLYYVDKVLVGMCYYCETLDKLVEVVGEFGKY